MTSPPQPTPPIFFWISDNWEWLSAIVIAVGALIWAWIKVTIIDRIKGISHMVGKISKCIPNKALDEGTSLVMKGECLDLRRLCESHTVSGELLETMGIVKQAMALVINHSSTIPQEQKDSIMRDLVK